MAIALMVLREMRQEIIAHRPLDKEVFKNIIEKEVVIIEVFEIEEVEFEVDEVEVVEIEVVEIEVVEIDVVVIKVENRDFRKAFSEMII